MKQSSPLAVGLQSVAAAEEDLTFDVPITSVPHGLQQSRPCDCMNVCHSLVTVPWIITFFLNLFHGPKYLVTMASKLHTWCFSEKKMWHEYTSTLLSRHPQRIDIYRLKAHINSTHCTLMSFFAIFFSWHPTSSILSPLHANSNSMLSTSRQPFKNKWKWHYFLINFSYFERAAQYQLQWTDCTADIES